MTPSPTAGLTLKLLFAVFVLASGIVITALVGRALAVKFDADQTQLLSPLKADGFQQGG